MSKSKANSFFDDCSVDSLIESQGSKYSSLVMCVHLIINCKRTNQRERWSDIGLFIKEIDTRLVLVSKSTKGV